MALENLIRAALLTPPTTEGFWGRPLMLWGRPGIGKTHRIRAAVRRFPGMAFERLSPGERGEGQFGVIGVPGADGYLHYPAPAWAQKFTDAAGLIFIDELNTAPPGSIQAALLGLIQLRVLGSHEFGPRTRTIGAANETADAAGGWDLPSALLNRFGHLPIDDLDASEWGVGFLSHFGGGSAEDNALSIEDQEKAVLAAWPSADAKARGLIAGFITRRPALLHAQPARGSTHKAWPSPRTVEYASDALASAMVQGLTESETDELMAAFVGNAWVGEFRTWAVDADLPNPADLLDGKVSYTHNPSRLDRTLAVLGACASLVHPKTASNRKPRGAAVWKLIGTVMDDAADIVVPAARVLVDAGMLGSACPESKPVLHKLDTLIIGSGIRRAGA